MKIRPCPKPVGVKHGTKICSPSLIMVTSPKEGNSLETTNKALGIVASLVEIIYVVLKNADAPDNAG